MPPPDDGRAEIDRLRAALRESEVRSERVASRNAGLLSMEETLATATSSDAMLATALDEAIKTAGADGGAIGLIDRHGALWFMHSRGFDEKADVWASRPVDLDTPPGRALTEGTPWFVSDRDDLVERIPSLRDVASTWQGRAALPVGGGHDPIGLLYLVFSIEVDWEQDLRMHLCDLADRIGRSLERMLLYEAERRSDRRTALLQRITDELGSARTEDEIARIASAGARAAVEGAAGGVVLLDGEELVVRAVDGYPNELTPSLPSPARDADGFLANVVATGSASIFDSREDMISRFPDRADRIRSLPYHAAAFLPLQGRAETLGVLNVTRELPRPFDPEELDLLFTIARQSATALERSRHLDDLERSLARERALQRITEGLARDRTTKEMAETVLDGVDLLGASVGFIGRVQGDEVLMLAARGFPPEVLKRIRRSRLGGPIAEAVDRAEPVEVLSRQDVRRRFPDRLATFEELGIHASVVVPVEIGGDLVAAIALSYPTPRRLNEQEWDLLDAIADLFAQGLERARAYEAELDARAGSERAMSRLARLQSVTAALTPQLRTDEVAATIVSEVMQALRADSAGLFIAGEAVLEPVARSGDPDDPTWDGAERVAFDSPLALAEAFRTGSTVWVPSQKEWRRRYPGAPANYHEGAESVLAVPLLGDGGQVRGVLGLLFQRAHALGKDERRLATTIGQHAGQALERARLYESERHLARRAARLQEIAAALAAAATVPEVAEALAAHLARAVGARSAAIGSFEADTETLQVLRHTGNDSIEIDLCVEHGLRWPGADAIATRGPVWIEDETELRRRYPEVSVDTTSTDGSWAALPLMTGSGVVGFVHLSFDRAGPFDDELATDLRTIAAQAAQAMDRARLFAQERRVTRVLQRSLLPREQPDRSDLGIAVRYQAGADELEVGGDWYEVIPLSPHRVGVAVGDVVGRGLQAAAAMGQLRSALGALALQDLGPIAVLDGLEAFAERTPGAAMSTVVYGELDAVTGEFRYCCAGHPPPLVESEGRVVVLEEGRSPLLAAGAVAPRPEASVHLAVGSTLVLYTDGLVERRGEHFDRGIQRLSRALAATAILDVESRADAIVLRMLDGTEQDDDVALMCVCRMAVASERFSVRLDPAPDQLGVLRLQLAAWLDRFAIEETAKEEIILATNEAVANAMEHGRHGRHHVGVEAWSDSSSLTVEVRDRGAWREEPSEPGRGHGLVLMRACMDTISIEPSPDGTTVRMQRMIGAGSPS